MKIIKYFLLLTTVFGLNINNGNKPKCINCKYFIRADRQYRNEYDGLCGFNGDSNLISNKISYENAKDCRKDENKCGLNGKNFELDSYTESKDLAQSFSENGLILSIFALLFVYFFILVKVSS